MMPIIGKPPAHRLLILVLVALVSCTCNHAAIAQTWPTRTVTLVVPYSAGGSQDAVARLLGPGLSAALGQQVVIDNVSGGGGVLGVMRVAKAPPDGYQFLLGNVGTHAQSQSLYDKPAYDAAADFVPVVLLVDQSMLLAVRKALPAGNLQEFITYARVNQAKMQYGSAGIGSPPQLPCLFMNRAGGRRKVSTHPLYRAR